VQKLSDDARYFMRRFVQQRQQRGRYMRKFRNAYAAIFTKCVGLRIDEYLLELARQQITVIRGTNADGSPREVRLEGEEVDAEEHK